LVNLKELKLKEKEQFEEKKFDKNLDEKLDGIG
jgi:hypothetical protein